MYMVTVDRGKFNRIIIVIDIKREYNYVSIKGKKVFFIKNIDYRFI